MRRRKTAFYINREDLRQKIAIFLWNGGKIRKIETPEEYREVQNNFNAIDPSLCGCGGSVSRNYPDGYFL